MSIGSSRHKGVSPPTNSPPSEVTSPPNANKLQLSSRGQLAVQMRFVCFSVCKLDVGDKCSVSQGNTSQCARIEVRIILTAMIDDSQKL